MSILRAEWAAWGGGQLWGPSPRESDFTVGRQLNTCETTEMTSAELAACLRTVWSKKTTKILGFEWAWRGVKCWGRRWTAQLCEGWERQVLGACALEQGANAASCGENERSIGSQNATDSPESLHLPALPPWWWDSGQVASLNSSITYYLTQ